MLWGLVLPSANTKFRKRSCEREGELFLLSNIPSKKGMGCVRSMTGDDPCILIWKWRFLWKKWGMNC